MHVRSLARSLARLRPIVPIGAVFILSLGYSMILFVTFGALGAPLPVADPLAAVLPSAIYDAVLGMVIGPLTVAVHDRRGGVEERHRWAFVDTHGAVTLHVAMATHRAQPCAGAADIAAQQQQVHIHTKVQPTLDVLGQAHAIDADGFLGLAIHVAHGF